MNESSCLVTLSRSYAEAAFDFAYENKMLDKWELMLISARNIVQNKVIVMLLRNIDCLESVKLADIFILVGNHVFDCFFQNFIRLMVEYKRLHLLPFVLEEFLFLRRQKLLVVKLEVVAAHVLEKSQLLKIVFIIKRKFFCSDNKIDVVFRLDRSIVGGFCVCFNDTIIDGSIRGRINQLRNNMLKIY